MSKPNWVGLGMVLVYVGSFAPPVPAQKLEATVLYRQDSDVNYFAVIPGYTATQPESSPNCALDPDPAECSPTTRTNQLLSSQGEVTYNVVGTTISLMLPDGRIALLNCVSKYSIKGNYVNRRTCEMPLTEHVQAELNGKTAKLKWSVGTDGKTLSETYKIVAYLDKQLIAKR
ncbi:MAG: hypothetical protein WBQ95_07685 [Terracidiphilus sp.]